MHQVRVASNNSSKFDREFISGGGHVVITEVKQTDTGVPVQSINEIASALVRNLAVRQIDISELHAMEDNVVAHHFAGVQTKVTT
jgi:predicted nucleic acid-binding protein